MYDNCHNSEVLIVVFRAYGPRLLHITGLFTYINPRYPKGGASEALTFLKRNNFFQKSVLNKKPILRKILTL